MSKTAKTAPRDGSWFTLLRGRRIEVGGKPCLELSQAGAEEYPLRLYPGDTVEYCVSDPPKRQSITNPHPPKLPGEPLLAFVWRLLQEHVTVGTVRIDGSARPICPLCNTELPGYPDE